MMQKANLTDETIIELFNAYKTKGDIEARNLLIEAYIQYAKKVAFLYDSIALSYDDRVQIGLEAVIKAVNKYTEITNISQFNGYLWVSIKNAVVTELIFSSKYKNEKSYEALTTCENDTDYKYPNGLAIVSDDKEMLGAIMESELQLLILKVFDSLTPEEQTIIVFKYGLFGCSRLTITEISKLLEISISTVKRKNIKILEKIRNLEIYKELEDYKTYVK